MTSASNARVGQQAQRQRQPVGEAMPAPAARGSDRAHLAAADRQSARVEELAERHGHPPVAVPAELDDLPLVRRAAPATAPARPRWRWRARRGRSPSAACSGRAKPTPSASATAARAGSTSTSWTCAPGKPASTAATLQPTIPAPTTAIRSPTSGAASHSAFTAVSTVPASTARVGRHVVGHRGHRGGRHHVAGLVRVEAEDGATEQLGRTVLDDADVEVAVLDRRGELALLERRPHRRVLARRHTAAEDEGLGAAAHPRAQRAHHHVVRARAREGRRCGSRPRPVLRSQKARAM